jgi:hypothetical protein
MIIAAYVAGALAVLAILYFVLRPFARAYLRYRGTRVIMCPEACKPAAVWVDAAHAAGTAIVGRPRLRLKDCSRWPERAGCDQSCLSQVETAPHGCLVRTLLAEWYRKQKCVFCGRPLGEAHWVEHRPALLNADGRTLEWSEVPPETIPDVLATHQPVCWDCHIAETFRCQHPELVVDRPWNH